jgi:hypothetical protein
VALVEKGLHREFTATYRTAVTAGITGAISLMTVTGTQVAWPLLRQVRSGHTHVDPFRR